MYTIRTGVAKPVKSGKFPLADIRVKGALFVTPEGDENIKDIAIKARNAVQNFKKSHADYNLSVHVLANQVVVYRNPSETKKEVKDEQGDSQSAA